MNSTYSTYEVKSPGGFIRRIVAKDSAAAKREYCRRLGHKPSDPWCGVTVLTARRVE